MKNRSVRMALVALALAAQAAAGVFVYRAERQKDAGRASLATLAGEVGRAQAIVGELRGAPAGLVAVGQDGSFWVPKITALTQDASASIDGLDASALAPDAAQDLGAAGGALADFSRAIDHVRDLLATDQPLTASSIVFGDAARHLSKAAGALASVTPSQRAALDREAASLRSQETLAVAGATLLTLVVLLLLLPRAAQPAAAALEAEAPAAAVALSLAEVPAPEPDAPGRQGFDPDISRAPAVTPGDALPEAPHESEEAIVEDLRRESQLPLNTEPLVDLAAAAALCSDLARVRDGSQLPELLGRAAELMNAAGVVLWMAGSERGALRPAASAGYADHALARMKAASERSDNAVSVAFRQARTEVVARTKEQNGAVVVPVVTANGCVGAMAAEIRHGAEASPSVQAVAAIIAAQLATLVGDGG